MQQLLSYGTEDISESAELNQSRSSACVSMKTDIHKKTRSDFVFMGFLSGAHSHLSSEFMVYVKPSRKRLDCVTWSVFLIYDGMLSPYCSFFPSAHQLPQVSSGCEAVLTKKPSPHVIAWSHCLLICHTRSTNKWDIVLFFQNGSRAGRRKHIGPASCDRRLGHGFLSKQRGFLFSHPVYSGSENSH